MGESACALGQAIYNLYGVTTTEGKPETLLHAMEILPNYEVFCGGDSHMCNAGVSLLDPKALVIHLNDVHQDSLDIIADKLISGPDFVLNVS